MTAPIKFEGWLDLRTAIEQAPPAIDFVLPALVAGTVGAIVGQGGGGKSFAAIQIATLVATGKDTLGLCGETKHKVGKVVYFSGEDPAEILAHRFHDLGARLDNEAREALYENLRVAPLVGYGANFMSKEWGAWVHEETKGARLVIIDTLRRFHNLDENNGGDMAQVLKFFEGLCLASGTTVIFVHHMSKGGARENGDDQNASRGSSVITDNNRWQMNLNTMSAGQYRAAQAHGCNLSERGRYACLTLARVSYAGGADGKLWLQRGKGGVLEPAQALAGVDLDAEPPDAGTKKKSKGKGSDGKALPSGILVLNDMNDEIDAKRGEKGEFGDAW